eukprot:tig00020828_g14364.t1
MSGVRAPSLFGEEPTLRAVRPSDAVAPEQVGVELREPGDLEQGTGPEAVAPQDAAYSRLLTAARTENFADLESLGIIVNAPDDAEGRKVVLVFARLADVRQVSYIRLRLFFVHKLHPIVRHPQGYVLVFFMSDIALAERPSMAWLKQSYQMLSLEFRKKLKRMIIVHPTLWMRALFAFFGPFLSEKFWSKLIYANYIEDLSPYLDVDRLPIPDSVWQSDQERRDGDLTPSFDDVVKGIGASSTMWAHMFAPFSFLGPSMNSRPRDTSD